MTIVAGVRRGGANEIPEGMTGWILRTESGPLSVVLGSAPPATARSGGWLVPPLPVLQLGLNRLVVPAHGRIVIGRYRPGSSAAAASISRSLYPIIAARSGFHATLVAVDPEGPTFSLSLWDSPENATANSGDGWFAAQVAKFDECYSAAPTVLIGSVVQEESA